MTIILALGNRQQVLQLSDRRISANGKLIDDESNKSGILFCPNARLAFGYTGLARSQSFRTIDWLLQALHESGPPSFQIHDIVERLRANATKTFLEHPALRTVPRSEKKLSIMFSGYVYLSGSPQQGYALLSNYVNLQTGHQYHTTQDEFSVQYFTEIDASSNPTFIQRIGNWQGITEIDIYRFRQLLTENKPREAILDVAVAYLKDLASRSKSAGSIGEQITSICISPDPRQPIETNYHSNVVRRSTHMAPQVHLFPNQHFTVSDISIEPLDHDTPALSVPKVSKNAPCPCGSKLRYKNCHGMKVKKREKLLPL